VLNSVFGVADSADAATSAAAAAAAAATALTENPPASNSPQASAQGSQVPGGVVVVGCIGCIGVSTVNSQN